MRSITLALVGFVTMSGCSDSSFDEDEVFDALDSWAVQLDREERSLTIVEQTLIQTWNSSGFMDGNGPLALVNAHPDILPEIAESFERIGFGGVAVSLLKLFSAWDEADGEWSRIDPAAIEEANTVWFDEHSPRYLKAIHSFIERNGGVPNP